MTEQEKRAKVIRGLECHKTGVYSCGTCPYTDFIAQTCANELTIDALAILKAQEPHVMTQDDMENAEPGTVVWCEQRDEIRTYMTPMIKYDDGFFENRFLGATPEAANLPNIRFWTSRPTDAQREVEPWHSEENAGK